MSTADKERKAKRKYSPELREKAFKLYCEEFTFLTISERWEVPVSRLHQWSYEGKWKERRAKIKAEQQPKPVADAGSSSETAARVVSVPENMTLSESQTFYEERMRREALEFVAELANMPQSLKLAAADKIEKRDKIARKALKLETEKPPVAINIRLLAGGMVQRLAKASDVPASETPSLLIDAGSNPATSATVETNEEQGVTGLPPRPPFVGTAY